MDIISTRGPYTHLSWCTAGECVLADPAMSLKAPLRVPVHTMNNQSFIYSFMDSKNLFLTKLWYVLQLRGGAHWRLLSAVRRPAGAGGWKRDPRSSSAGEEDETAEEEHAAGEGGLAGGLIT